MEESKELDLVFYMLGWICIFAFGGLVIYSNVAGLDWIYKLGGCQFRKVTGFYCPGCGGTRAVFLLLKGHIIKLFLMHPIVVYIAFLGGAFMVTQTVQRITFGKIKIGIHFRPIYLWIAMAIIFLNWIIKNVIIFIR